MTNLNTAQMVVLISLINFLTEVSSETSFVCFGDQLTLTCGTNGSALTWTLPNEKSAPLNVIVFGSGTGSVSPRKPVVVDNTTFQFSITSLSPLESMMLVDNVTADVNGIKVSCRTLDGTISTIIYVIDDVPPNTSLMINESYRAEGVEVILEWTVEPLVTYNVSVTDDSYRHTRMTENSSLQLTLSYNIMYHVSFVATQCGHNSTTVFELKYVKCGYPLDLPVDDDSVTVSGYSDPALVGTKITISCVSRSELTGKNTSMVQEFNNTCMDNGRWEPDPRQGIQKCYNDGGSNHTSSTPACSKLNDVSRKSISSDLDSTCITESSGPGRMFVTLSYGAVTAVVLSVILLVVIFFAIGFVCGCFSHKYKRSTINSDLSKTAKDSHAGVGDDGNVVLCNYIEIDNNVV